VRNLSLVAESTLRIASPATNRRRDADTPPARPSRRATLRRTSLPGGRAVVGGFLIATAAVGLFASYSHATERHLRPVVVAAHDIEAGQRLSAGDVKLVQADLPPDLAAHAVGSVQAIRGDVVTGPVASGELLQSGELLGADQAPAFREITIEVDAAQLRALSSGDTADVLVTLGTGESSRTDIVASGARVLQLPKSTSALDSKPSVTLGLPTFDLVYRVVQASHAGSITLVRSTGLPSQTTTYNP
jgi:Flp pilus assembly protein CpaB